MPIIIPKKSIYKTQNEKILDNLIRTTEISVKRVSYERKDDEIVFETTEYASDNAEDFVNEKKAVYDTYPPQSLSIGSIADFDYLYHKVSFCRGEFLVPKLQDDQKITELKEAKFSLIGTKTTANVYLSINFSDIQLSASGKQDDVEGNFLPREIYLTGKTVLTDETLQISSENELHATSNGGKIVSDFRDLSDVSLSETEIDGKDYVSVKFCVPSHYTKYSVYNSGMQNLQVTEYEQGYFDVAGENEYVEYDVQKILFQFYGNAIIAELKTKTEVYGNGENPIKIEENDFIQSDNIVRFEDGSTERAIDFQSQNLINEYKDGKETAVIVCSVSDYYTNEGILAVSPDYPDLKIPMVIPLHSDVVPMVGKGFGEEPMSRYRNGAPKIFKVLGRKIIYDGELMQELHLQEVSQKNTEYFQYYDNGSGKTLEIFTDKHETVDGILTANTILGG